MRLRRIDAGAPDREICRMQFYAKPDGKHRGKTGFFEIMCARTNLLKL